MALAQSTAYTVLLKVFLSSDHVTVATGKTVAITISKAGGAFGNPNAGASNATEISGGWYKFALDTTDTGTLGDLVVVGTATSCDPAERILQVVSATTGGATNLDAAVSAVKTVTDKFAFTVANQVDSNVIDWKGSTAPAMTGDAFARLGAPAGASVSADIAAAKVDTAAIKAKTDSLTFTVAGVADANVVDWKGSVAPANTGDAFARLGAPAGASVSADVAAVKVDTAAVKVQTDKLAFTVTNQVDANVLDWKSATAPAMTGDAFARLGAPAGASVSADVAAVKSDTGTILTDVNSGAGAIYTRIGAPAGASLAADIAAVNAKTANLPGSPAAVGSAMALTSSERDSVADALLDRANAVETSLTVRNALRAMSAMLFGRVTGAQTGTEVFREAVADVKARVTITDDATGNRSVVSTDFT